MVGCSRSPSTITHARYQWYPCDVADEKAVRQFFQTLRKEGILPYGLINNAGVAFMNTLSTTTLQSVQRMMSINYEGTFLMMREAMKTMHRAGEGRIVNFTSVAEALHLEWEGAYAASKAAIVSLTKTAAREWGQTGITVNAVGPGPLSTDMLKNVDQQKIDFVLEKQAIKRMSRLEDVAQVCDFFLSPKSAMITGQTLYLGGVSA